MCNKIIDDNISDLDESVRPVWKDGKEAHTIKNFGVCNRYDLSKEFPILTLRKVPFNLCLDEILWIWQKKSNNISDLHSSIWNAWADKNGTIGKAYGYQMNKASVYKGITEEKLSKAFGDSNTCKLVKSKFNTVLPERYNFDYVYECNGYKAFHVKDSENLWALDQTDMVIYMLKTSPFSRRIITNLFNHDELNEMSLYPCAYSMTFNVTKDSEGNKVLNGLLNQRSQDILVANGWNVTQYAALLNIIAKVCNMKLGEFVHIIADAHIYDRHIDTVKTLISMETHKAPELIINKKDSFYDYTIDDIYLAGYEYSSDIKGIDVAI